MAVDLRLDAAAVARAEPADVTVAITEDSLVTEVRRGENRGRTLRHTAVVRSMMTVRQLLAIHCHAVPNPRMTTVFPDQNLSCIPIWMSRGCRMLFGVPPLSGSLDRYVKLGSVAPEASNGLRDRKSTRLNSSHG